jgi:hypothetical protein
MYELPDGTQVDGMDMVRLVRWLEAAGVLFEWTVSGSPDASVEEAMTAIRRRFQREDLERSANWWSVQSSTEWEYLPFTEGSPQQFLLGHSAPGLRNVFERYKEEDELCLLSVVPKLVRVTVSMYGYDVDSVFGDRAPRDQRKCRLISALYGFPAEDLTTQEVAQARSELGLVGTAILREWCGQDCEDPEVEHARAVLFDKE